MSLEDDVGDLFGSAGLAWVTAVDEDVWEKRRRIRAFFLSRFKEAAPGRVRFESSAPIQSRPDQRSLPALNVFTLEESSSAESKSADLHELQFVVDVLAEGTGECVLAGLDLFAFDEQPLPPCPCIGCKLDQYGLVVRAGFALHRLEDSYARGLIESAQQVSMNKTIDDRGDKRFGSIRFVYLITYATDTTGEFWPD